MSGADNRQLHTFASFFVHNFQFVYDHYSKFLSHALESTTRKILNDRKGLDNETADNVVSDEVTELYGFALYPSY